LQQGKGTLGFHWDFLATRKGDTRVVTAVVVPNLHVGLSSNKEMGTLRFQWDFLAFAARRLCTRARTAVVVSKGGNRVRTGVDVSILLLEFPARRRGDIRITTVVVVSNFHVGAFQQGDGT
jgi:hypothetical protein